MSFPRFLVRFLAAGLCVWAALPASLARAGDVARKFDEHLFRDVPGDYETHDDTDTPLAEAQFSLPWLILEKDTGESVLARFGTAPSTPGLEDHYAYCYEDSGTGVVAELAGFRGDIIQVTLLDSRQRLRPGIPCGRAPAGSFTTATAGGLRLGLTRAEVRELLGQPLHEDARRMYYDTTVKIPMTQAEKTFFRQHSGWFSDEEAYFDSVRSIILRLDKDRVFSFTLRKITGF